jgi:hemolysin III
VFAIAFLLTSSTLFHFFVFALSDASPATQLFRRLDHIGIWLVIGGFFILPHLIGFSGGWRWLPLGIVWSATAAGFVFKVFFFGQLNLIYNFTLYAAVSAVGVVSVVRFAQVYGAGTIRWILACYGSYIAGAYFLLFKPLVLVDGLFGSHEIWHVSVLVGTWCHWAFVLWLTERVAIPAQPLTPVNPCPRDDPLSEGVASSLA